MAGLVQNIILTFLWMVAGPLFLIGSSSPDADVSSNGQWLIRVAEGVDAEAVAQSMGAEYVRPLVGVEGYHRIRFLQNLKSGLSETDWKGQLRQNLEATPAVEAFEENVWMERFPRSFVPPDPRFADQWHLENEGQTGGIPFADARVRPAWDLDLSGEGVTVAIVDEGIQYRHPDLISNWVVGSGYDYNGNDTDPSPGSDDDRHGTAVAGISLADSNSIGGLGIAHNANLVPLRLIAGQYQAGDEAEALSYRREIVDVYNNSWGPSDQGVRYADSSNALKSALEMNTRIGRGGLGNIYVWAAGNGGLNGDNSNYDGYNSSPYTISVGAVGQDDIKTGYSEPGANLLVVAPSGGRGAGILTTDNTGSSGYDDGDYYDDFSGTSAAAPMVTGVVALLLEQRPNLNWRDVQQILARTATPVDFSPEKWAQNGAGLWVSHDYGFGRVDAGAAVKLANSWESLPPLQTLSGFQFVQQSLPFKVEREGAISISGDFEVHSVEVTVDLNHSDWGDVRIELESPDGTRSVLAETHRNSNTTPPGEWTYLTMRHMGESSQGIWKLFVIDDETEGTGQWIDWSLSIICHDVSGTSNAPPAGDDLVFESTTYPIAINTKTGITDANGDNLEVLSIQYPSGGGLVSAGNGIFEFTMGETKNGWETFSVLFGDGNGAVKRRIVRVLDPRPVARKDLFPLVAGGVYDLPVLSNDLDPDGDPIRIVDAGSLETNFVGSLEIVDETVIRYTAPSDYFGVVRFPYSLTDDSDGTSAAWVTLVLQESADVALKFDGEDDLMLVPPTTGINMRDKFTAEAWIYPESYGEYVTGFGRIYDRDTFVFFLNGFDHGFYNDRSLVAYFITDEQQPQAIAANSAANVIDLDRWQHVAISYDSTDFSSPVRMYVDGQPVSVSYPLEDTSAPRFPIFNNSNFDLYMGESDTGARAFKGSMTEFRVWNRVLNSSIIQLQHDIRLTGSETGLQLYLPLDQTLEPEAISLGSYTGTAQITEALRVPLELPWAELEHHYTMISDAGSGWWEELTLGWVYGDHFPWVYLPSLNWAYTGHNEGSNDYYLYPAENNWGWLHTSPALYPWYFQAEVDNWIWYLDGSVDPAWFYGFASGEWRKPYEGFFGF